MTGNACTFREQSAAKGRGVKSAGEILPSDSSRSEDSRHPDTREIPTPSTSQGRAAEHLASAYRALGAENYTAALDEIEPAVGSDAISSDCATLYLTGLIYADPRNPASDAAKAREILKRVETDFPDSEKAKESRIVAEILDRLQVADSKNDSLNQKIQRLKKQLAIERKSVRTLNEMMRKMKEIDLGMTPKK